MLEQVFHVVKDIRTEGLDRAAVPMVYMPYFLGWGLRFIVRSSSAPETLLPMLRARVAESNPGVLLQRFRPLAEILGATMRRVAAMVLREGLRIVVFGAVAGVAGSVAAGRLIERELYEVGALDLPSFAVALGLLSSVALAACLIPAFKAGRVDPVQALNMQ